MLLLIIKIIDFPGESTDKSAKNGNTANETTLNAPLRVVLLSMLIEIFLAYFDALNCLVQ